MGTRLTVHLLRTSTGLNIAFHFYDFINNQCSVWVHTRPTYGKANENKKVRLWGNPNFDLYPGAEYIIFYKGQWIYSIEPLNMVHRKSCPHCNNSSETATSCISQMTDKLFLLHNRVESEYTDTTNLDKQNQYLQSHFFWKEPSHTYVIIV